MGHAQNTIILFAQLLKREMACKQPPNFIACFCFISLTCVRLLQPENLQLRYCTLPRLSLVRGLSMSQTPTSCCGWTSIAILSTFSTWTPSRTGGSLHYHTDKKRFYLVSIFFVREIHLPGTVGAVVPVEGSKDVIALVGRKVCLVNRETG